MSVTSARALSRAAMAFLPPSSAVAIAVLNASIAALKLGISTGGLGYAGLPFILSCIALRSDTKSESVIPVVPRTGLMIGTFVLLSAVVDIVFPFFGPHLATWG